MPFKTVNITWEFLIASNFASLIGISGFEERFILASPAPTGMRTHLHTNTHTHTHTHTHIHTHTILSPSVLKIICLQRLEIEFTLQQSSWLSVIFKGRKGIFPSPGTEYNSLKIEQCVLGVFLFILCINSRCTVTDTKS